MAERNSGAKRSGFEAGSETTRALDGTVGSRQSYGIRSGNITAGIGVSKDSNDQVTKGDLFLGFDRGIVKGQMSLSTGLETSVSVGIPGVDVELSINPKAPPSQRADPRSTPTMGRNALGVTPNISAGTFMTPGETIKFGIKSILGSQTFSSGTPPQANPISYTGLAPSMGASADAIGNSSSPEPSTPFAPPSVAPISPVAPPNFEFVPMAPVEAPSFTNNQTSPSSNSGGKGNGSGNRFIGSLDPNLGIGNGNNGGRGTGLSGGLRGGDGDSSGRGGGNDSAGRTDGGPRGGNTGGPSGGPGSGKSDAGRGKSDPGRGPGSGKSDPGRGKSDPGRGPSGPSGNPGSGKGDPGRGPSGPSGPSGSGKTGPGDANSGSLCCPILLDLDGTGLSVSTIGESSQFNDITGSGFQHRMAWAGAGTGVLVFDADGDGKISQSKEFAFVEWAPTASSDFEALRQVFDTNGNGKLDAGDAGWASFRVAVGDQLLSLDALGITSIDLTPTGSGQTFADGSAITGTSTYTKSDGTTGTVGDAVLVVDANGYRIDENTVTLADGSSVRTIHGYHPSGQLAFVNEITTSADGLTRSTQFDDDGDGIYDRSQLIAQGSAPDGTWTKTVSDFSADGSLLARTVTITSGDGATITTTLDSDGDGIADQQQIYVRHADGSSTTTTEELSVSGNLLRKVEVTASADGLTKTTRLDANGTGTYHLVIEEQTVVNPDGSKTKTVSQYSADNTLISRTITAISADGRTHTVSYDRDGDGVVDGQEITSVVTDAAGNVTTEVTGLNGDGSQGSQANTKLSPDGQSRLTEVDLDGDGIADLVTTETTTTNGSIWTETIESKSADGTLLSQQHTVIDTATKSNVITADINGDGAVDVEETGTTLADGSTTTLTEIKNRDGSLKESSVLSVSADGLSRTLTSDLDGDGVNDLVETDVTIANPDGSRTRTLQDLSRNGSLIGQTVIETGSDGLTIITRDDVTGDGVAETITTDALVLNADGSRTRTVATTSADGTLLAKTVSTQGSDRKSSTVVVDDNGDGHTDLTVEEILNADGSSKAVETYTNADGSVWSKITNEVSADRLTSVTREDIDGDGVVDFTFIETTTLSSDGSRTTVESDYAGTTLVSQTTTQVSANGLVAETAVDGNGDGTVERYLNDTVTLNADGSTTRTEAVLAGSDHGLVSQVVTTTSSNGLQTTISVDRDGDGQADRVTQSVKTLNANGSVTETTAVTSENGSKLFQSQIDISADKNVVVVTTDIDGDGNADLARNTIVQANGSVSETTSTYDNSVSLNKLTSRSTKTVSENGFVTRIEHDIDGNGTLDYSDNNTVVINDNGSRTETVWRENGVGALTEKTIINTSANGLSQSIEWLGADGVSIGSVNKSTAINADGSTIATEQFNKADGTIDSRTELSVSADKMTTVMTSDVDGDGLVDQRVDIQRQADGQLVSVYTDYAVDGVTVADRKTITETADGNFTRVDYDSDGDGLFDKRVEKQVTSSLNGDVMTTISTIDGALTLMDRTIIAQSADGLTVDSRWDFDGDNQYDRRQIEATILSGNGSTTRSVSNFDANNVLTRKMESTTSANGLASTVGWDLDGSGAFEQVSNDVSVINGDGTTTRTITNNKDGSLFSKSVSTTSADGNSQTVVEEFDGLGLDSRVTNTKRRVRADGAAVETRSVTAANGVLLEKQTSTTSVDGRSQEIDIDVNGDGTSDQKKSYVQYNDGSRKTVTTGYRSIFKTYQTSTTVSADGLRIDTEWDEDGNGTIDRRREVINQFNIDGSRKSTSTDRSSTGAVLSTAVETVSADGLNRDVARDVNGDGITDVTETQRMRVDGQVVTTTLNNAEAQQAKYLQPGAVYWQASVAARIERTVSSDGLTWTERSDFDGNGTYEHVVSSVRQIDGATVSTIIEYNADGSVKATGTLMESSDGRTRILSKDIDDDGVVDETQTSVTRLDGSSSWTMNEFSTNGTLVQTTTETHNAMGKLGYRLVQDGLGRKTGELVFDTFGRSVYSLYDGATGQLLSETKLDKEGVKTSATLFDPLNGESWTKIVQTYSFGKLSSQNKTNDDGTTEKITYSQELPWIVDLTDPLNAHSWSTIRQTYSGGKLWIQDRVNDNGTQETIRYNTGNGTLSSIDLTDPLNVESWSSVKQTFSNGVLSSYDRRWDDGTREVFTYDTATQKVTSQTYYYSNGKVRETNTFNGQTGGLLGQYRYETDGRIKDSTTIAANGTRKSIWYDTVSQQVWTSLEQNFNEYGQLTTQVAINDDTTRETWSYDPKNINNWSIVYEKKTTSGQLMYQQYNYDDGKKTVTQYDVSNTQSWKQLVQFINVSGLRQQNRYNDDGTTEYWWWDVDHEDEWRIEGVYEYRGWNHIYEKRNAAGQVIQKAVQWDDGGWTYPVTPVVLDLNGDGALDLNPLNTDDTSSGSATTFDWDGDGVADQTAWVGPNDGLLVIDLATDGTAGADSKIDQAREIAFSLWKTEDELQAELRAQGIDDAGRQVTDLEGLRFAFDSNGDNVLDSSDERWSEFRVWQDSNQNGIVDDGELKSLDEVGIKLINLLPSSDGSAAFADGSAITGTATAEKTDGSTMLVGDATFNHRPSLAA
uniref:Adhesin n=1 Tax=Ochrobactrum sp. LM19 TaxID=1449781 RepID=A0A0D5A1G5_9HYPH|nr:adhesin [Ochrobactrum sp. LM19]AJW30021.1 adhesin [Ochrobactrum sp. LM19]